VGEVEVTGRLLARVCRFPHVRRPGERVGNREFVLLKNILTGLQVPPRVTVARFGREQRNQEQCAKPENDRPQPRRRRQRELTWLRRDDLRRGLRRNGGTADTGTRRHAMEIPILTFCQYFLRR